MHYNLVLTRSSSLIEDFVSDVLYNSSETQISREKNSLLAFAEKIDKLMREYTYIECAGYSWKIFGFVGYFSLLSCVGFLWVNLISCLIRDLVNFFFKKNHVALLIKKTFNY